MDVNPKNIEEQINQDSLEYLLLIIKKDSIFNVLLPLIIVAVFWLKIDHFWLLSWFALMVAGIGFKYWLTQFYYINIATPGYVNKSIRRLYLAALYYSLLWGSTAFLFYVDGSPAHQIFLITLLLSISSGSIAAGVYLYPLCYITSVPIMLSLMAQFSIQATLEYFVLAFFLLWATFFILAISKKLNRRVRSEMRLRRESAELIEALNQKTEEAQQATREKARFLAAASHDLRQPLHTLALFVDVLKDTKDEPERELIFPRIERSLDALRKLFDALLDISRLDAGVVKPEITHFRLREMLDALIKESIPIAREHNIRVKIRAKDWVVVSDRMLLERVFRNIISNAIRYTESGGVLISLRKREDHILCQVWDTGIGIPDDSRADIFDEFHQLQNQARDRSEGLGLGLSIVKRLCHLLHHKLEFKSVLHRGTVFSVEVLEGSATLLRQERTDSQLRSWDLSGRHLLVIDDEPEILEAMNQLLLKWGCIVTVAESLNQAMEALGDVPVPDIILSDLRLCDGETGIDAMNSLREKYGSEIPGILITGDTSADQLNLAQESGYDLMQKPVRPTHLRAIIQYYLSDQAE